MKLKCLKKDFEEAVETTSRIVSNSATLPVLRCIILEADDTTVTIHSTNLEISIKKSFKADITTKGKVAIPANIISSILKASNNETTLTLDIEDNSLVLTIGGSKTKIKTIPFDDFPTIPKPETEKKYKISKKILIQGIRSVLYSASTSLIKPELASVYMYYEDGYLIFVATDSFRLAEKKILYKTEEEIPSVIMPIKNTVELVRILEMDPNTEIEVYIDENQYSIYEEGLYITLRIINGSFPDYKAILPKDSSTEVIVFKNDLLNTLKKAQIFSDKFGQITIHIYPNKKTFTISAINSDVGELFDSIDSTLQGEDVDISFNYRYLLDVFQSITSDSMSLTFSGIGKPLIIKNISDSSFIYLVMPMNR